jgi:hypothetical protein
VVLLDCRVRRPFCERKRGLGLETGLGFLFLILVLWKRRKGKRFLRLCTPKIATCADRFKVEGFSAAESGSGSATVDGLWRVANEPQGGGWESGLSYTESTLDSPRGLQSLGLCYSECTIIIAVVMRG